MNIKKWIFVWHTPETCRTAIRLNKLCDLCILLELCTKILETGESRVCSYARDARSYYCWTCMSCNALLWTAPILITSYVPKYINQGSGGSLFLESDSDS
jgi:hypothetical protein